MRVRNRAAGRDLLVAQQLDAVASQMPRLPEPLQHHAKVPGFVLPVTERAVLPVCL